jgi:two-component system, cell cycle sensor histidine kinase and response regulator CckA
MQQDKESRFCNDLTNHTAGVIHDVNNMLWAICCMADLIKEEIPKNHVCQERAETIAQAAQRCTNLLSTPLPARVQSLENKEEFNLISLIKEVQSFVACLPLLKITFEVNYEKAKVIIYGNKSDISSALMNLFLNAIEAMPDGGTLYINTHLVEKESITNSTDKNMAKAEKFVIVDIKDTGIGIPSENLPHIFEPHFTTKRSLKKKNLGMGLWRVKQCVARHGGSIHVSSSPGNGTSFSIRLPVVFTRKKQNSRGFPPTSIFLKRKKVLVIDNDETIRDAITMMLNNVQIDVIAHSDSKSAITWISEHIGHANIAIVEHNYPVLNGIKCVKTLQSIDPGLKCILCSCADGKSLHVNSKEKILVKPFLKNELFTALNISMAENKHFK